jgi:NAD(P) transhydrogenase subunit alpha
MLMTKDGAVVPDFDDEVVAGACLTHGGRVMHAPTAAALVEAGLIEPDVDVVPASEAATQVMTATPPPDVPAPETEVIEPVASESADSAVAAVAADGAADDDGPAFDVGRDERLDTPEEGQAR